MGRSDVLNLEGTGVPWVWESTVELRRECCENDGDARPETESLGRAVPLLDVLEGAGELNIAVDAVLKPFGVTKRALWIDG